MGNLKYLFNGCISNHATVSLLSGQQNSGNSRALDSRTKTTTPTTLSHRTTLSMRKQTSFWREKHDAVVILVRSLAKMLSSQKKS